MKKKTGGKKRKRGDVTRAKDRIQKLLTKIVRLRDEGCIFKDYDTGWKCGGYTAADHIISRMFSETYADLDNVVCVCTSHHIRWKPANPTLYTKYLNDYLGEGWITELEEKRKKSRTWTLDMWLEKEQKLKDELETLERQN